jgi:hypothetical protein
MQEWHGARNTVTREKARAMLYTELGKDRHSGRGVGHNRNEDLQE